MTQLRKIAAKWRSITPQTRFWLVLALILVVIAGLFAESVSLQEGTLPFSILRSLAEALTVALVIASIVDPYIKSRLARDIANDLTWALINPDCPDEFKDVVLNVVRSLDRYTISSRNTLAFSWEPADLDRKYLRITSRLVATVQNTSKKSSSSPLGELWILKSADAHESTFKSWRMQVPNATPPFDETLTSSALATGGHISTKTDGRSVLDEVSVLKAFGVDFQIAPGETYTREVERVMIRRANGHLPIVQSSPAGLVELRIEGPALEDLDVVSLLSGGLPEQLTSHENGYRFVKHGLLPGHSFIVQWKQSSALAK